MRKFTKGCLIVAAGCAVLGIGFGAAGLVSGATFWTMAHEVRHEGLFTRLENLADKIDDRAEAFGDSVDETAEEWEEDWESFFTQGSGEEHTWEAEAITKLEADLKFGSLYIGPSGDGEIHLLEDNSQNQLEVSAQGNTLKIEGDSRKLKDAELQLLIPENLSLQKLEVEMDAGVVSMEDIQAEQMDVKIGMGQFQGGVLRARESQWEVGAGQILVESLDSQKTKLDCGVGEISMYLAGVWEDYDYEVKCELGDLTVGEESYDALSSKQKVDNNGTRELEAVCQIGAVDVQFEG